MQTCTYKGQSMHYCGMGVALYHVTVNKMSLIVAITFLLQTVAS